MAVIRPFCAIRPDPDWVSDVAALPYDVYNRKEAWDEALRHPNSFLNIDRPETQFKEDHDMYAPEVYEKASDMLQEWLRSGILLREDKPCYYIYALTMDGRVQAGLAACSSIDDYMSGVIRKHENTREEKELDRIRHVDVCSMQTGPIFLAYRHDARMDELTAQVMAKAPLYDFTAEDSIRHTIWRISDPAVVEEITWIFSGMQNTYIADGHHRAASAVKVGLKRRAAHPDYKGNEEFNYFLSVLFPENQLKIFDYNRIVKDLNGLTEEEFLEKLSECFDVHEVSGTGVPYRPAEKGEFGLFLGETWYALRVKPEFAAPDDPVRSLDVSILQDLVLAPILGILDPKTDHRIDFIGGIRGLGELERRVHTDMKLAFSMHPTSLSELFRVADAGLLMPPKSTWFEPKLRSGLLIHEFER